MSDHSDFMSINLEEDGYEYPLREGEGLLSSHVTDLYLYDVDEFGEDSELLVPEYRSISLCSRAAIPDMMKEMKKGEFAIRDDVTKSSEVPAWKSTRSQYVAPRKPSFVLPTSFKVGRNLTLEDIKSRVESVLIHTDGISFEFNSFDFEWSAAYAKGAYFCDARIRIFSSFTSDYELEYTAELQRTEGDSMAFHQIYEGVQSAFVDVHPECVSFLSSSASATTYELSSSVSSSDSPLSGLSMPQLKTFISSVIEMTEERYFETKLEACKLISDLANVTEFHIPLCEGGASEALLEIFISADSEYDRILRLHAVMGLAQLSAVEHCQTVILQQSGGAAGGRSAVLELLNEATDGHYLTSALRCECARILATLAKERPEELVAAVGEKPITDWIGHSSDIKDGKMSALGDSIKSSLQPILCC